MSRPKFTHRPDLFLLPWHECPHSVHGVGQTVRTSSTSGGDLVLRPELDPDLMDVVAGYNKTNVTDPEGVDLPNGDLLNF